MEQKEIKAIIECMLFVSDKPLSLGNIQGLLEEVDRRTVLACLDELKAEYDMQGRAFHLVEIAEGYQLATRVQYAPWIRKMFKSRTSNKLSRAALETLAIIAYRQPVTKAEIEDIRGVSADGVVNALLDRKFIRIVGRKEVIGRPILYGTTKEFLHYFGLKDLSDMPMLKDLQDILESDEAGKAWEINPQGELVAKIKADEDNNEASGPEEEQPAQSEQNEGEVPESESSSESAEAQQEASETADAEGNGKRAEAGDEAEEVNAAEDGESDEDFDEDLDDEEDDEEDDDDLDEDLDDFDDSEEGGEELNEDENNGGHPHGEEVVAAQIASDAEAESQDESSSSEDDEEKNSTQGE